MISKTKIRSTFAIPSNVVILPRQYYDRLQHELEAARERLRRSRAEEEALDIVADGDRALGAKATITAVSSRAALKQWYARR